MVLAASVEAKKARVEISLFFGVFDGRRPELDVEPGAKPSRGRGGFKGGWKGCTTRVPQFITAWTVWHKQGGLDRTVVKKPREGINGSEDL